jgi:hypothetical protein
MRKLRVVWALKTCTIYRHLTIIMDLLNNALGKENLRFQTSDFKFFSAIN